MNFNFDLNEYLVDRDVVRSNLTDDLMQKIGEEITKLNEKTVADEVIASQAEKIKQLEREIQKLKSQGQRLDRGGYRGVGDEIGQIGFRHIRDKAHPQYGMTFCFLRRSSANFVYTYSVCNGDNFCYHTGRLIALRRMLNDANSRIIYVGRDFDVSLQSLLDLGIQGVKDIRDLCQSWKNFLGSNTQGIKLTSEECDTVNLVIHQHLKKDGL